MYRGTEVLITKVYVCYLTAIFISMFDMQY